MTKHLAIKEFMTKSPHCIEPKEDLRTAVARMIKYDIRHLPVRSGRKIVGVISQNDINFALRFLKSDAEVSDVMITDPYCVKESASLFDVCSRMISDRISSTIIIDDQQEIVGIYTYVDALIAIMRLCN